MSILGGYKSFYNGVFKFYYFKYVLYSKKWYYFLWGVKNKYFVVGGGFNVLCLLIT